jgi:hypothetical protein
MKKLILLVSIVSISFLSKAQTGMNQIGIAAELGLPMGDFGDVAKTGFGGLIRGAFGVGTAGQVTLTTGYTSFGIKDELLGSGESGNLHIIPILVGYRHHFSGFFVEPQLGYGIYGSKFEDASGSMTDSEGAFTYGAGLGYSKSGFEGGVRYQAGSKDGSTTSYIGIHVGYNFNLGGATANK